VRRTALLLLALALTGCETTAERSARLERAAKQAAASRPARSEPASLARPSLHVRVLGTTLLRTSHGAAAAVTLRNDSSDALKEVPLELRLTDAHGRTVFQNDSAGSEGALVSVPSIPAHAQLTWVDDQLPAKSDASAVSASVGTARAVVGAAPVLAVAGVHLTEEGSNGGAAGTIRNRSKAAQLHLVVFAVARRGTRIVAAGRAVLADVGAGSSAPFQVFFVGDARGAQLQISAPPVTFG
jgi:hypothetical protein